LPLEPLEVAEGYRRLRAFGWTNEQIGNRVTKTATHVAQLLLLSTANSDVKKLVMDGSVRSSVAIKAIRQHGEGAGAYLEKELSKAKSVGKKKVTAGTIAGKRAPLSLYRALYDACWLADAFDQLPQPVKVAVEAIRAQEMQQTVVPEGGEETQ
jgi:ParB-like chromosome segregation protein Spo0J